MKNVIRLVLFTIVFGTASSVVTFADGLNQAPAAPKPIVDHSQYYCQGICQRLGTMWNDSFTGAAIGPTKEATFVALAKFCQKAVGPNGAHYGLSTADRAGDSYGPEQACHRIQGQ